MYEKLYKEFDSVKPSAIAVDKAVESAVIAEQSQDSTRMYDFSKRKMAISILAASMVLVFTATFIFAFFGRNPSDSFIIEDYGFIISANANQVEALEDRSDSTIAAYAGILSGGWAMYPNFERYEDYSPNFFQSYAFTNFSIEGKGIESVTFKSNAEGTYFAISPAGYFVNANEENAEQQVKDAMKDYSDLSLVNSQYTAQELREYSDGLSYGNIYCDSFTYTNARNSDVVNLSNKLEFIIESNHSNKDISEKLDRLWQCEEKITEYKAKDTFEYGEVSEEEDRLYEEIDMLSLEIRQLILADSTVDVIVNFTDGSVQTKSLRMGLAQADDETYWLTVTEE